MPILMVNEYMFLINKLSKHLFLIFGQKYLTDTSIYNDYTEFFKLPSAILNEYQPHFISLASHICLWVDELNVNSH